MCITWNWSKYIRPIPIFSYEAESLFLIVILSMYLISATTLVDLCTFPFTAGQYLALSVQYEQEHHEIWEVDQYR